MIPVIIGSTGTLSKSLEQYLSNIPGEHEIKDLEKKKSRTGHCTQTADSADVKVQNIPGKHEIKELQKNGHIRHCKHTLRKELMYKYKT
jgi:hypothetical protein